MPIFRCSRLTNPLKIRTNYSESSEKHAVTGPDDFPLLGDVRCSGGITAFDPLHSVNLQYHNFIRMPCNSFSGRKAHIKCSKNSRTEAKREELLMGP